MGSFYDRIRSNLGYEVAVEPVPEPGLLQQWQTDFGEATRLSTQQRMHGVSLAFATRPVHLTANVCMRVQGSFSLMGFKLCAGSAHFRMLDIGWHHAQIARCATGYTHVLYAQGEGRDTY